MTYNNMYSSFKKLFPECAEQFNDLEKESFVDDSDGMHIVFSLVVIPFVLKLLKTTDVERLRVAFAFFEKMAESDAREITEVLEFTVIENLMSNGREVFETAKQYMGKEMLDSCERVGFYMDIC